MEWLFWKLYEAFLVYLAGKVCIWAVEPLREYFEPPKPKKPRKKPLPVMTKTVEVTKTTTIHRAHNGTPKTQRYKKKSGKRK